jgi:hypothetical protein
MNKQGLAHLVLGKRLFNMLCKLEDFHGKIGVEALDLLASPGSSHPSARVSAVFEISPSDQEEKRPWA